MSGYTSATLAVMSVIGAATSAVGAIQSGQAQQRQAEFQGKMAARNAQIADQNARLAQEEGREAKKVGYENAVKKRQEAAMIVGAQRAAQGAAGVQVDAGSALDLNLDTVEKGEIDALALLEQGQREDYMKRVDAWNMQEQASGMRLQSSMHKTQAGDSSYLFAAGGSLLSGLADAGSNYYKMTTKPGSIT